jgi:hypothetical protein
VRITVELNNIDRIYSGTNKRFVIVAPHAFFPIDKNLSVAELTSCFPDVIL